MFGLVLIRSKNLLNDSHRTNNKWTHLILIHLLRTTIHNPFIQEAYSWALKYSSDFLQGLVSILSSVKRGIKHLFPPGGSHSPFRSRILPSKTRSAYSQHPTACSVMPKRWIIVQAPDIPLASCPFLYKNLIGTVAEGMGGMFRIGGGRDENRWWFGRVIKTLDICFNELATQQTKYCNSKSPSSQPVTGLIYRVCLLLVKPCIFHCLLECHGMQNYKGREETLR